MTAADLLAHMARMTGRIHRSPDPEPIFLSPGSWVARSPLRGADCNMACLCGPSAAEELAAVLELLEDRSAVVLVGAADADAVAPGARAAGLREAGRSPVMTLDLRAVRLQRDPRVRRARGAADLERVRALRRETFVLEDDILRDDVTELPTVGVWLLEDDRRPVSVVVTDREDDLVGVRGMATPHPFEHHGFGHHLLEHALSVQADEGASSAYLLATAAGEPLYEHLGFATIERVAVWVKGTSSEFA
jgi:N-acetylglutamate synthase-like GNAT family acetyltransferase